MFGNVVIGIDGRQGGRDAIELARQLAAPEAAATLAHVYDVPLGPGAARSLRAEHDAARELLERERGLAAIDAQLDARAGHRVGHGLQEIAQERQADLLVVGSTRRALLGRVLAGDDCRAALDGAPCAAAVAPRGYGDTPHRLRGLGVGYDGSPECERALHAAQDLAAGHGGAVTVFWVVSFEDVRQEKPIPADWPGATAALIDRRTESLAAYEGVHGVVTYGGPREELVRASRDLDLLIVSSRGSGRVSRILHGSVSRYLQGHVACPLLVLPHAVSAGGDDAGEGHASESRSARPARTTA